MKKLTYDEVGVVYEQMDPFKVMAQGAAVETFGQENRLGVHAVRSSLGGSAFLLELPDIYLAHVEEGLGSKNLVADAMYKLTGTSYYDKVAQDTVAMIVNDLLTVGALPVSIAMHLAAGSSDWFKDVKRMTDLVNGWKKSCQLARCVMGGGETPTLRGLVHDETVLLSGSAIGVVDPKDRLVQSNISIGDRIILIGSSGIHANGLTLARTLAGRSELLPKGYLTELDNGRSFGEALLEPTLIYVDLVESWFEADIQINYLANITGHGWRKLMRSPQLYTYVIDHVPPLNSLFDFIQENGPVDNYEAYSTFNMGAGYALFVPESASSKAIEVARQLGYEAWDAGYVDHSVEQTARVVINPLEIEYIGLNLQMNN